MTDLPGGFFVERISIVGPDRPTAQIDFSEGLNVVSGASDTGKSYLCSLIDFAFGASKPPRAIEAAKGYERVVVRVHDRSSGQAHDIERSLVGGDAKIRRLGPHDEVLEERIAAAKHSAEDATTLSAFLLGLSGFRTTKVRTNKKGDTRTLSFRDVAFLAVVDETRIIAELPPQLSGSYTEKTVEGEVFRFLVTGVPSIEPMVVPRKPPPQGEKAQLQLVQELIAQVEKEVGALALGSGSVEEELAQIDQSRSDTLQQYEASRVELVSLERDLAAHSRSLREAESRLGVVDGLVRRFELLDRHYESDVARLSAIREAGVMLESLPAKACPVCGAAPEEHRPEEAAAHYRLEDVRIAADAEREKVRSLRADLQRAVAELADEATQLESGRNDVREEIAKIEAKVSEQVQPRVRGSAAQLQQQASRRDVLMRARVLVEKLDQLRARSTQLERQTKRGKRGGQVAEAEGTTADMDAFAQEVQAVLVAWHFPEKGRVVFAEESQDLVVGGQPRVSHGKGVRALTCSAFIAGLMRHCLGKRLPHPGLVVLDSPLVAYKDPDTPETEGSRFRQAGVKDAFYGALADGLCKGQVIVLENEDPPPNVAKRVTHHHFTKGPTGRYGLFPVRAV